MVRRRSTPDRQLLKIGFGLHSRAVKSRLGQRLVPPTGLAILKEALEQVGIETYPSRAVQDYNGGRTAQVPTGSVVAVRQRVRRKLGYGGISLSFERAQPAAR